MGIQQNMATVIHALKEEKGKSLADFSEELEISRSTLQNYLSGICNPTIATVEHLAKKLHIDVSFLLSGTYSEDQIGILMNLLEMLKLLLDLSPVQRRQFAELLWKMVCLWDHADDLYDPATSSEKVSCDISREKGPDLR